ncbi:MAG: hypothetical protein ABIJ56_16665 [Pseudomonadota bacterium]
MSFSDGAMRYSMLLSAGFLFAACSLRTGGAMPEDGNVGDVDPDSESRDWTLEIVGDGTGDCAADADCSDGEPCNGKETCSEDGLCRAGEPLPDGEDCSSDEVDAGVCRDGLCVPENCGDGVLDDGEECDDGGSVPDDGCEPNCTYSCRDESDCAWWNECMTGLCQENDNGKACVYAAMGGIPCNDGRFCTSNDLCDEDGNCRGNMEPCRDGLDCTTDDCEESAEGPDCLHHVIAGYCMISGECFLHDFVNLDNACEKCLSDEDHLGWTNMPDMQPCSDGAGICCDGQCRSGGDCCHDADCGGGCSGSARSCDGLNAPQCGSQDGCSWEAVDGCTGSNSCDDWEDMDGGDCPRCGCRENCGWDGGDYECDCEGTGSPCESLSYGNCEYCGCRWGPADEDCTGDATPCEWFDDDINCDSQAGCNWDDATCSGFQCT